MAPTALESSARVRPAGPHILHEAFEDEVVILDRTSGRSYGLDGLGAEIWRLMLAGQSLREIAASLISPSDLPKGDLEQIVGALLSELCEEGIVTVMDVGTQPVAAEPITTTGSPRPRPPDEPGPTAPFLAGHQPVGAYGFFPTAEQELLLRAALLAGDQARDAFVRWQDRVNVDALDHASFRLLPLLYQNLLRHSVAASPPLDERLRETYRTTWFRTQMLLRTVADVLGHFQRSGMRTLVLKGVPLAIRYYPTPACRPMSDADVLVPAGEANRALTIARAAGLVPLFQLDEWPPRFTASRSFAHPDGWEIDIHTHVMHGRLAPGADDAAWQEAQPLIVGETTTLALTPEDNLLHVIGHGLPRNALAPIRWVPDAVMIIRACGPGLDWWRVLSQARASHMSFVLGRALRYLNDRLDIDVPAAVLDRCVAEGTSVVERFEFRSHLKAGPVGWTAVAISDWLRARAHEREWQGAGGFVRYLRDRLYLNSAWRLPGALSRIAISRTKAGRVTSTRETPPGSSSGR